jgi:hypothetical protein
MYTRNMKQKTNCHLQNEIARAMCVLNLVYQRFLNLQKL